MKPSEATTALFVPGDRPDRAAKALASEADIIIIDLEDAVEEARRPFARSSVINILRDGAAKAVVRINGPESADHDADLELVAGLGLEDGLLGVLIAKAESASAVEAVAARLRPGVEVLALVESAKGLACVQEIALARGLSRLALGAVDLGLDLGSTADGVIDIARFQVVLASRVAGIAAPLDTPSVEILDLVSVAGSAAIARSFGFGGKLCIHPAQLAAVRQGFAPTAAEIEWAELIMATQDTGAAQIAGMMVDRPVFERARRILAARHDHDVRR